MEPPVWKTRAPLTNYVKGYQPYAERLAALKNDTQRRHFIMVGLHGTPINVTFVVGIGYPAHGTAIPTDFYYNYRQAAWVVLVPHKIDGEEVEGNVKCDVLRDDGQMRYSISPGLNRIK